MSIEATPTINTTVVSDIASVGNQSTAITKKTNHGFKLVHAVRRAVDKIISSKGADVVDFKAIPYTTYQSNVQLPEK